MKLLTHPATFIIFNALFLASPALGQIRSMTDIRGATSCSNTCYRAFASDFPSEAGCSGPSDWPCLCKAVELLALAVEKDASAASELGLGALGECIVANCDRDAERLMREMEAGTRAVDVKCTSLARSKGGLPSASSRIYLSRSSVALGSLVGVLTGIVIWNL
ncbi:hypothetical protein BJ508DRAFT_313516 [Ascobolus immersus RN42]|uniref:Extracellular membrane protein CFEM domain-containing protein n=1 Tax=Ascobolus immersus RN42 TaxID=1160509 RepID=A0A3N4HKD6_ASCIM|nr:hypothetical protein BJ508DRAFT_313516 [Ascobolus immersus RN42]